MNSHKINLNTNIKVYDENNNLKFNHSILPNHKNDWTIGIKTDEQVVEMPMRSFNRNFPAYFFINLISGTTTNLYQWNGNVTTTEMPSIVGGIASLDGIRLGTGSLTPLMTTYNLSYELPNNIMAALGTTWVPTYASGSTYEFGMYRTFVASQSLNITEMKLCTDTTYRFGITFDSIDVSGSAINLAVPSGSTVTAWARFNVDEGGYLTKNFLNVIYSWMRNTSITYTSTTSASQTQTFMPDPKWVIAGYSDVYGLMIGSNTSSFTTDDFRLYGLINDGTGSGQLTYLSTDVFTTNPPTLIGSSSYTGTVRRTYLNLSGGDVTIGEAGIYMRGNTTIGTEDNLKLMMCRVPFPNHITLKNRESAHVSFTFEFNT